MMLRILFTNARGLTQDWRRAGFYEWIGKMGVQVVCVTETKCHLKTTKGWHCVCHPEVKNGGVTVLVKKAPSISVERQGQQRMLPLWTLSTTAGTPESSLCTAPAEQKDQSLS